MTELSRTQVSDLISNLLQRGIDLEALSEKSGIPQSLILLVMKGQLRPSPEVRLALANALGVKTELLV